MKNVRSKGASGGSKISNKHAIHKDLTGIVVLLKKMNSVRKIAPGQIYPVKPGNHRAYIKSVQGNMYRLVFRATTIQQDVVIIGDSEKDIKYAIKAFLN